MKFRLFAELGLEIFLRFATPTHSLSDNWFYTFNSADVMSRHPYPDEDYLIGNNYFPINGGLLINSLDTYLHIFPDFPIGAGMPDRDSFELHLHRNPYADDDLGIGEYYGEYSPAEHSFLFGFTDLKPKKIWKEYLQYKTSPLVFFKGLGNSLVSELENSEKNSDKWEYQTEYSLVNEDKCAYLSSIVVREDDMICRIMNICDQTITPEFDAFTILEELNALGGELENRRTVTAQGELEFTMNENSGRNMIQYPKCDQTGLIKPFSFNTYRIELNS